MRYVVFAAVVGLSYARCMGADGIAIELPKDHPLVARLTTAEVKRQACGQPIRAQVIVQRFETTPVLEATTKGKLTEASQVLDATKKNKVIDQQVDEINGRVEKVSQALAGYPKARQIDQLTALTREKMLAAADRKLKERLDQSGAVLLVGVNKGGLSTATLDVFDRLGVVTDPSSLGLCKVPEK